MKREFTCIICPKGCRLTVDRDTVTGNSCPKGAEYAISECYHPVRTVTATVRIANRPDTMVSVKTEKPVAKGDMAAVMVALRNITLTAPVPLGTVVAENICGSRIVTTKSVY